MFGWSISNAGCIPCGSGLDRECFRAASLVRSGDSCSSHQIHPLIHCGHGIPERRNRQGPRHPGGNPCVPRNACAPPGLIRFDRRRRNDRRISRRISIGVPRDGRCRPRTSARAIVKGSRHEPLIPLFHADPAQNSSATFLPQPQSTCIRRPACSSLYF